MRALILCAATLMMTMLSAASPSQTSSPARAAIAGEVDPSAVVADVRRIIAARYVLPEKRPLLDAALAEGLSSGRYATRDPGLLAQRINADLEHVARDRHLNFKFDPDGAAVIAAVKRTAAPDTAAYEQRVRSANHGIAQLRVLPGNIRYMAYDGFMWMGPESAAAIDNAMRFLAGGDAVIIDLRRNGGGDAQAVRYMISHFLPAGKPLVTFYMNGNADPSPVQALDALPAGRMIGKPLYVLTSGVTASAAEEFAGHVSGYRLGELIGETTGGAGFRNDFAPIQGGFVLSLSVGRAVLASTGRDWEKVGIEPTVRTDVEKALDVAQIHAVRQLLAQAPASERARLEVLADGTAARLEPRQPALPLAAYAGRFGERVVSVKEGRLYYFRGRGLRTALIPLGDNRFAFEGDPLTRISFIPDGNGVAAFELSQSGAPAQGRYERTP